MVYIISSCANLDNLIVFENPNNPVKCHEGNSNDWDDGEAEEICAGQLLLTGGDQAAIIFS